MVSCFVHKNMCTVMSEILCLIQYPKLYNNGRKITDQIYKNRTCKNVNEKNSINFIYESTTESKTNKSWIYLMIIRNPIDRFISGFIDRCDNDHIDMFSPKYCYGCRKNLTCALNNIYNRMSLLFFNKYLLIKNPDDYHFAPQTWRCNLQKDFHLFTFLNYSQPVTFYSSLIKVLGERNVDKKLIEKISNELQFSRTYHSTITSNKHQKIINKLNSNPDLMALLIIEWHCGVTAKQKNASLDILIEGIIGKQLFIAKESAIITPDKNIPLNNIFIFVPFDKKSNIFGSIRFLHSVNRCCIDYYTCNSKNFETLDCGYTYYYCLGNTFQNISNPLHILGYWLEFYKLTVNPYDHYLIIESLNKDNF
ncbi:Sulfotransferase family-containing protein [Strongyloides ratti]|uniref:Sulfotransferase family-containing protein n=1 Tax=Strongyloides ratti TaxID=34506 RepID=A0A090MTY8_STRRB|nr:Sulfotransferase family-containing protein [Strongyloides ratti]CEF61863.1 Sulfotransferase family-containing protein [Strongyloides ratti]